MPNIVRSGGLNLSDEVVKIKDLFPVTPPAAKGAAQDDFTADFSTEEEAQAPDFQEQDGLEGEDFTPAPKSASRSISKEEIIQGAMTEASRIIEDAIKESEAIRAEQLAQIHVEAARIRQSAAEEGHREGFAQVVQQVQESARALENAIALFEGERAGFESEFEKQLQWMAAEIASKVLVKKVEADDSELLEMVKKAVQGMKNEAWIRVEVSNEMTRLIDLLIQAYDGWDQVDVSAIPAQPGTVKLETPAGIVDISLRTQLENLREYFRSAQ